MRTSEPLRVETTEYRRNHGAEPRGRGSWAFCPSNKYRLKDYLDHTVWMPPSTYSDAKKALRATGASGYWTVCP